MPRNHSTPGATSAARIKKNPTYRVALARAGKLLKQPARLAQLVGEARDKAGLDGKGPLAELWQALGTTLRLLQAYGAGEYRDVSWYNLVLIVAALVYFVAPLDMIPDLSPVLGLVDDSVLLTWTLSCVGTELERFSAWERRHAGDDNPEDARENPPPGAEAPPA